MKTIDIAHQAKYFKFANLHETIITTKANRSNTMINKNFYYSHKNRPLKQYQLINKYSQTNTKQNQENKQFQNKDIIKNHNIYLNFNDLIFSADFSKQQNQLVVFPSIQRKRSIKKNTNKQIQQTKKIQNININKNHIPINKHDYKSNILLIQNDQECKANTINWKDLKQIKQIVKQSLKKMPKINPKVPKSQKGDYIYEFNNKTRNSSLSSLTHIKQSKIIQNQSNMNQKKYKKGYLAYQQRGNQKWQHISNKTKDIIKPKQTINNITAKIFMAINLNTFQTLQYSGIRKQIQIASLTKIMTCYLVILICKKYEIDMKNTKYRVTDSINEITGTSAQLQAGDILTIQQLLYGLMLPSGNDAATCLAECIGKFLHKYRKSQASKTYYQSFISHMNSFSKQLKLNQIWGNSSGLSNNPNTVTAQSIMYLTLLALQNPIFCKIISTRQFQIHIKNDRYGLSKHKVWKNTNKLLHEGWSGVKTGTTQTAGHCLIALKGDILVGLFDCQTMGKRFSDAKKLVQYVEKHQN